MEHLLNRPVSPSQLEEGQNLDDPANFRPTHPRQGSSVSSITQVDSPTSSSQTALPLAQVYDGNVAASHDSLTAGITPSLKGSKARGSDARPVLKQRRTSTGEVKPRKRRTFRQDQATIHLYKSRDFAHAPVWTMYAKEASQFDVNMLKEWDDELNVLIVFAALFSAILTAFIIGSYSPSQSDNMLAVLLRISDQLEWESPESRGPYPSPYQPESSTPTGYTLAISIFWYMSLAFSLLASMTVMLVKQWMNDYTKGLADKTTPQQRTRQRQLRYDAIVKWRLPHVIRCIPVAIHFAVMLFLCGLALQLYTTHWVLGGMIIGVICTAVIASVSFVVLPLVFVGCPYKSPMCDLAWFVIRAIRAVRQILPKHRTWKDIRRWTFIDDLRREYCAMPTLRGRQEQMIEQSVTEMDTRAFHWLVSNSSDPQVRDSGVLAYAAWGPPEQEWKLVSASVADAASDAVYRLVEDVVRARETELPHELVRRLQELAAFCSIPGPRLFWGEFWQWEEFIPTLIRIAVCGLDDAESDHSTSSRILACVVLLHLKRFRIKEKWVGWNTRTLTSLLGKLLADGDNMPIYATSLLLHYLSSMELDGVTREELGAVVRPVLGKRRVSVPSELQHACHTFIEGLGQGDRDGLIRQDAIRQQNDRNAMVEVVTTFQQGLNGMETARRSPQIQGHGEPSYINTRLSPRGEYIMQALNRGTTTPTPLSELDPP